jgi:hypothetical protein
MINSEDTTIDHLNDLLKWFTETIYKCGKRHGKQWAKKACIIKFLNQRISVKVLGRKEIL